MKLEELIQKHRPSPGTEDEPCGSDRLFHLNQHGLIEQALTRQAEKESPDGEADGAERPLVISRIVAWEASPSRSAAGSG